MAHQWRSKFLLLLLLLIQHLVKHNIWKMFVCLFVSRWFNSTNQSQNTLSKILCFYFIFSGVFWHLLLYIKHLFCVGFSPQSVATLQKCFFFFFLLILCAKYMSCTGTYFLMFPRMSCRIYKKAKWNLWMLLRLWNLCKWNLRQHYG